MKKAKIAFCILIALGFLAGAYFAGHHIGQRDAHRAFLRMTLNQDVYLYHEAESGNLAEVKTSLGFFTFAEYNDYETYYGGEKWLPARLQAARQIATLAATNGDVDWVSFYPTHSTNRMPNTALEPTPTAP